MDGEYLLFNLVVLAGPLLASFEERIHYRSRWGRALAATLIVAGPYLLWDALVAGKHWWFNEAFTVGHLLGLPPGEWLFFVTVPFACLFVWELLALAPGDEERLGWRALSWAGTLLLPLGAALLAATGLEYTGLVAVAAGAMLLFDRAAGTRLFARRRGWLFAGAVAVLILVFNGYLTGRPVVLYGEAYQLGVRVVTIPLEDFFYGFSHLGFVAIVYELLRGGGREPART